MIPYLINMTLCALLLYAVYLCLLEKEKMHRFKRFYLLGGLVFSMTVPLLTINTFGTQMAENIEIFYTGITEAGKINAPDYPAAMNQFSFSEMPERFSVNYPLIFMCLYLSVTFCFLVRMLKNLLKMHASTGNCDLVDYCGVKIILLKKECIPHSFGKRIFVNEEAYRKGEIPEEILLHEWAHIRQKHSLDIIFIELLIAFFWFNPVFYLYRYKIGLNHEFLADETVLGKNGDIFRYQTLLIYTGSRKTQMKLVSNFNYLITKKRLIMMKKKTSKKRALWRIAALFPVLTAAIFAFSQKTAVQNETTGLPEQNTEHISAPQNEPEIIVPGQGVSSELLDEYKEFEKKYLEKYVITKDKTEIKWKSLSISEDDWKRMYVIYFQMNKKQRNSTLIHWLGPLSVNTRQKTNVPSQKTWESWNNPEKFEIRIDGEKAGNVNLKSLNRLDYVQYFVSKSLESEKENLKLVDLWTTAGYDVYHQQNDKSIPLSTLLEIRPNAEFQVSSTKSGDMYIAGVMAEI